jgi:hypothetical protein
MDYRHRQSKLFALKEKSPTFVSLKTFTIRILMPVQPQPESIFSQLDFGHKKVVFCSDPDTGLKAIIAIHDTTLGPALGEYTYVEL